MTSNRLNDNELAIQAQKRISELERANQALSVDILQCKQKEHKRHRYNLILQGINLIFGSFVKAETEEKLGNKCLSVALEVTGGGIGFVGEVGADGLLHDIAISDMGWSQCFMYDKTGHRRAPGDFILHGFYGRIVDSGKGFFTNDPSSHPDSIGLPEGHPPLTAFLGVPLILDGKIIGILAVANRENGYSLEQQEDLEAIAPAVVQVLHRKREEKVREKTEKALHDSEELFRAFVTASSEMVYRVSPNWREMRYLYGRGFLANTESPSYNWLQEYVLPEDQQHLMSVINEAIRTKSTYELEHRVRLADGSIGWILSRAVPIMDSNGEIVEWFGAASDITKRKEAEAKLKETLDNLENLIKERTDELENAYISLKESEKRLAEAQKIAHIGNWVWDIATGKEYWSDELYHIFKLDPQKAAPSYKEYLSYVHPDDRDYVDNAFKGTVNGKPYEIDHRIVLANGEERTVHIRAEVVFNDKNIPVQTKGIVQDITERKKAEENIQHLANIVESTTDAVVTVSLDGIVTSWNKGAEQIFGYTAEEILGKKVSILEPENLRGEIKKLVENIKQGEKVKHYESSRLKKDGTVIIVSGTLFPVFDASRKLVAISVIVRDITDIKRAEKALRNLELIRKKEIHHRIKNNLQVISSLLDLQAEKFHNRECIKDSEIIEAFRESQDRVTSIALIHEELHEEEGTTDTLNFSLYLQRLVESLFQTYKFGDTDISLNLDLEEDILFDMDTAVPLGMIVNELVSNSLKYAFLGRKAGEIQIKLFRKEAGNNLNSRGNLTGKDTKYTLIVSDNGIGIPEEIDFESSDTLGLQLVNLLVDQLDGTIELKRDNGTEFMIQFNIMET